MMVEMTDLKFKLDLRFSTVTPDVGRRFAAVTSIPQNLNFECCVPLNEQDAPVRPWMEVCVDDDAGMRKSSQMDLSGPLYVVYCWHENDLAYKKLDRSTVLNKSCRVSYRIKQYGISTYTKICWITCCCILHKEWKPGGRRRRKGTFFRRRRSRVCRTTFCTFPRSPENPIEIAHRGFAVPEPPIGGTTRPEMPNGGMLRPKIFKIKECNDFIETPHFIKLVTGFWSFLQEQ